MPNPENTGDYRDVLPFWQARSTWAALAATLAMILSLFGVTIDAGAWTDKATELATGILALWAYIERLRGTKRLILGL
jgi:hypothetical protein